MRKVELRMNELEKYKTVMKWPLSRQNYTHIS